MKNFIELKIHDLFILSIKYLSRTIDAKDKYTMGHSDRVRQLSVALAERMNLKKEEISIIYLAAQLHDVGKARISENILKKKKALNDIELNEMKNHVIYAQHILGYHPLLKQINTIIKYHHERFDGSGYPYGLKGNDIPLFSRIIAVADSFDAMISERIYAKRISFTKAIQELITGRNILYDGQVVNAFIDLFDSGEIEYILGTHYLSGFSDDSLDKGILLLTKALNRMKDQNKRFLTLLEILKILNKKKDLKNAGKVIKQVENISSEHNIAINDLFLNEMALYHYYAKQYDEVIKISEMILSSRDISLLEKARANRHLAMSYWKLGDNSSALVELSYAEDLYKELSKKLLEMPDIDYDVGFKFFEKIIDNQKQYEHIIGDLAKLYDLHGRLQTEIGNFEKALDNYNSSIELKNEIGDTYGLSISYGGRGSLYSYMGKYDKAEYDFIQNIRISKKLNVETGLILSGIERVRNFIRNKKISLAKKTLKEIYETKTHNEDDLKLCEAAISCSEGKFDKIKKVLDTINYDKLLRKVGRMNYYFFYALYYQLNDPAKALENYKRALDVTEKEPNKYYEYIIRKSLMQYYYKCKNKQDGDKEKLIVEQLKNLMRI